MMLLRTQCLTFKPHLEDGLEDSLEDFFANNLFFDFKDFQPQYTYPCTQKISYPCTEIKLFCKINKLPNIQ